MTAATMVDGRRRMPPVTLIHATAVPAGWLLAKVLTVGISSPKWHLKCEVMAVLVAQAPQAEPRTWVLAFLPSLDIEVTDPRAKSAPVRCCTNLTGLVKIGESDLGVGCYVQFEKCTTCAAPFIDDTKPAHLNPINRLNLWIWHFMTIWGIASNWITHTGFSGLCSRSLTFQKFPLVEDGP